MKHLLLILTLVLLSSCSQRTSLYYYQLYHTISNEVKYENEEYYFENGDVKIIYDFWKENGNSSFIIQNKTDKTVYLNLEECYYIVNGFAYDYYLNRNFGESSYSSYGSSLSNSYINYKTNIVSNTNKRITKNQGETKQSGYESTLTSMNSAGNSVNYEEKKIINLPPSTKKYIGEYPVNEILFFNCDLKLYPDEDDVASMKFDNSNTPIKFHNYLTYSFDKNMSNPKIIKNEFWVSEIANYDIYGFTTYVESFDCQNQPNRKYVYKYHSPNRFYIKYDYYYLYEGYSKD